MAGQAVLQHEQARWMARETFQSMLRGGACVSKAKASEVCVLYVGLDGMSAVNEAHGYEVGDKVLVEAGRRLCAEAGAEVSLCRPSGDEFALLLGGPLPAAEQLAKRLVDVFRQGVRLDNRQLPIGVSVGIAASPRHGSPLRLLSRAAFAMRLAKRRGGGGWALFDSALAARQQLSLMLARELREAAARDQLELVYQPKIDTATYQITAVEALLRWRHPAMGQVSPGHFIPVAERFGLMGDIGNWVVDRALHDALMWREQGLCMRVAVNVSSRQFREGDFAERLTHALEAHKFPPSRFTCEITESVAVEDTESTHRAFSCLQRIGVHISIDDFGTGYSSLSALRRLPASELKLDRSFVADIVQRSEARAIVHAVVEMAHALKLRVVAEGVETAEQRDLLMDAGCHELQGYLFAKPMSAGAISAWARDFQSVTSAAFKPSLFKETGHSPI